MTDDLNSATAEVNDGIAWLPLIGRKSATQ
jgi:hypothetical protein